MSFEKKKRYVYIQYQTGVKFSLALHFEWYSLLNIYTSDFAKQQTTVMFDLPSKIAVCQMGFFTLFFFLDLYTTYCTTYFPNVFYSQ